MTWGTTFKTDISLLRKKYQSIIGVEESLNDIDYELNDLKSKIKMFSASNINEITPEDDKDNPIIWLNRELNNLLADYDDLLIERYKLYLYLEYLKNNPEHNIKDDYDE